MVRDSNSQNNLIDLKLIQVSKLHFFLKFQHKFEFMKYFEGSVTSELPSFSGLSCLLLDMQACMSTYQKLFHLLKCMEWKTFMSEYLNKCMNLPTCTNERNEKHLSLNIWSRIPGYSY